MRTHGTISCYSSGCPCRECLIAARDRCRKWRARTGVGRFKCRYCGQRIRTSRGRTYHETRVHGQVKA